MVQVKIRRGPTPNFGSTFQTNLYFIMATIIPKKQTKQADSSDVLPSHTIYTKRFSLRFNQSIQIYKHRLSMERNIYFVKISKSKVTTEAAQQVPCLARDNTDCRQLDRACCIHRQVSRLKLNFKFKVMNIFNNINVQARKIQPIDAVQFLQFFLSKALFLFLE